MGMFNTREPRRFRRVSIYTDESKEKLQKLVDSVKREQGELPPEEEKFNPEKFKGTFSNFTPRAQKYKERGTKMGWPLAIVLILLLLVLWRLLLTGKTSF